jgi:hypothetical protein
MDEGLAASQNGHYFAMSIAKSISVWQLKKSSEHPLFGQELGNMTGGCQKEIFAPVRTIMYPGTGRIGGGANESIAYLKLAYFTTFNRT